MRVGLVTWGTEGDVRPFFALAHALLARGHEVSVAYCNVEGRSFDALATTLGFRATAVGADYFLSNREALFEAARRSLSSGNPMVQLRRIVRDLLDPIAPALLEQALAMAEANDVLVGHFLAYPITNAVAKVGRPALTVTLQPVYRSREYAPPGSPDLGRWLNPLLWRLADSAMAGALQRPTNRQRVALGMAPIERFDIGHFGPLEWGALAVSPSLFPRPSDWHPRAQVTGFLSMPESAEPWEPPREVGEFLAEGPPVFASFGSMFNLDDVLTQEALRAFAGAAERERLRVLVQAPASLVERAPRHPRLCYVQHCPHAQVFPRCSVIVHHGGAGTTQSSLLAGRPSVVVPHVTDQYLWGSVLHRQGAGSSPLRRTWLTAGRLAKRLRWVLDRPEVTARAEALARELRAEDGCGAAAALVERVAAGP
ncbi:MAG: glycosyltransferase family 1 protein [Deltaproteobacteria bacterium]|nr:glycosyltransferase family 1 protein [Deltaproteobacteria bacterium]